MITINYSDANGRGVVHANCIFVYIHGPDSDHIVNPMAMIGYLNTYHFGTNKVLFEIAS